MKTDSEIMTEIAHKTSLLRQLSPDESIKLKKTLLTMYSDLDALCRKHGLDLMLVGGSALGAARNKGFIPWDDDLDVALSRKDYDILSELLESGKLGEKYEFTYPSKHKDSKNLFLKIFLKGTINAEILDLYSPFPKGIYIDVFPIEYAYAPGLVNALKSKVSRLLSFISVSVFHRQYRSKEYQHFMCQTKEGKQRYKLRMALGAVASFLPHKTWVNLFDRFVRSKKDSNYVTIPTGRKGYAGETLPKSDIFPVQEAEFEGLNVKVPGNLDKYLTNLYGDYMILPPEDKRERHYIVNIDFGS